MIIKVIFFILVFSCIIQFFDRIKYTTNCIPTKKIKKREKVIEDKKQDSSKPTLFAEEKRSMQIEISFSPKISTIISPRIAK